LDGYDAEASGHGIRSPTTAVFGMIKPHLWADAHWRSADMAHMDAADWEHVRFLTQIVAIPGVHAGALGVRCIVDRFPPKNSDVSPLCIDVAVSPVSHLQAAWDKTLATKPLVWRLLAG
jgi:hypothetical protein